MTGTLTTGYFGLLDLNAQLDLLARRDLESLGERQHRGKGLAGLRLFDRSLHARDIDYRFRQAQADSCCCSGS